MTSGRNAGWVYLGWDSTWDVDAGSDGSLVAWLVVSTSCPAPAELPACAGLPRPRLRVQYPAGAPPRNGSPRRRASSLRTSMWLANIGVMAKALGPAGRRSSARGRR